MLGRLSPCSCSGCSSAFRRAPPDCHLNTLPCLLLGQNSPGSVQVPDHPPPGPVSWAWPHDCWSHSSRDPSVPQHGINYLLYQLHSPLAHRLHKRATRARPARATSCTEQAQGPQGAHLLRGPGQRRRAAGSVCVGTREGPLPWCNRSMAQAEQGESPVRARAGVAARRAQASRGCLGVPRSTGQNHAQARASPRSQICIGQEWWVIRGGELGRGAT